MGSRQWTALIVLLALVLAGSLILLRVRDQGSKPPVTEISAEATNSGQPSGVVQLFKTPEDLPAFTMTDIDGRTLTPADWRGKVVLVNFWATWCPPCRAEIPDLIALQKKYRDRLVIVGVSEDEIAVDQVRRFATGQGMNYPIVMTTPEIRKVFRGVVALPTTFVLDRDGRLAQKHVGMLNAANTEAEARVLAGLDVDAKVERIDSSDKARITSAAEAKAIPGIDLTKLSDTQKQAVVQALIAEDCTCGCGLTLAVCRLDDPTCPVSLPMAQDVVKKYSAQAPSP
jgi:thiol-disulfide isomerase/thioredoxin